MDYVESVLAKCVTVHCESAALRIALGAAANPENSIAIEYKDKGELASVLTTLQTLGIPFVSAGPCPPSDVFEFLRRDGLVAGVVRRIVWRDPADPKIYEQY